MRLAVVGSRDIVDADVSKYIPDGVTEIVSGGASGVDALAAAYARDKGLKLTEFLPQYNKFGRAAPLRRNEQIVRYADEVLALWDGISSGTRFVIEYCRRTGVPCTVVPL